MGKPKDIQIGYELNPPKVLPTDPDNGDTFDRELDIFLSRAERISHVADCLHLTDSVLGVPRMSSITAASLIRSKTRGGLRIICNIRTCDHNLNGILQMVGEAKAIGVEGITLIKGDTPKHGESTSNNPLNVLSYIRKLGFREKAVKIYLTLPVTISAKSLNEKLSVEPDGFVTQPITDLHVFERLADNLISQRVEVVASIMIPSEKNRRSANLIGVDWASYENDVATFVRKVAAKATEVLLSSPNNFEAGLTLAKTIGGRK